MKILVNIITKRSSELLVQICSQQYLYVPTYSQISTATFRFEYST